jgi:hypothetical protein
MLHMCVYGKFEIYNSTETIWNGHCRDIRLPKPMQNFG